MGKLQSKSITKTPVNWLFENLLWEADNKGWKAVMPLRKELGEVISDTEVTVTFDVGDGKQLKVSYKMR